MKHESATRKRKTKAQIRELTRVRVARWSKANPGRVLAMRYRYAKRFCERYEQGEFAAIVDGPSGKNEAGAGDVAL